MCWWNTDIPRDIQHEEMWSKISHDTAQKNIAGVALMGSIPEGLVHAISGLQSYFSNDWLVAFYKIKNLSSTSYCLIQRMGKKHTAENNSKQTLCYVRHTAHGKHFGLKVHSLFLMIILVHKGWSHRTLLSLETKKSPRYPCWEAPSTAAMAMGRGAPDPLWWNNQVTNPSKGSSSLWALQRAAVPRIHQWVTLGTQDFPPLSIK